MVGYTLDKKKLSSICQRPEVLNKLVNYLDDDPPVANVACKALINMSADDEARASLLPLDENDSRQVLFFV